MKGRVQICLEVIRVHVLWDTKAMEGKVVKVARPRAVSFSTFILVTFSNHGLRTALFCFMFTWDF